MSTEHEVSLFVHECEDLSVHELRNQARAMLFDGIGDVLVYDAKGVAKGSAEEQLRGGAAQAQYLNGSGALKGRVPGIVGASVDGHACDVAHLDEEA